MKTKEKIILFVSVATCWVALGCGPGLKIPSVHEPLDSVKWKSCAGIEEKDEQFVGLIDEIKEGNRRSMLCRGVMLAAEGKIEEGLELLNEVAVKNKEDHRPHYLSGRIFAVDGRYEEALAAFQRSKERFADIEVPSERLGRQILEKNGEDQARVFLSKTEERDLCPYGCRGLLARLLHKAKETEEAEKLYNKMVKNNPNEPAAYVGLASISNVAGDYLKESEFLTKATEAKNFSALGDSQKADVYYSHAFSRYNSKKYKGAAKAIDRAFVLKDTRADWWVLSGWIHLKLRNPAIALVKFEKAGTIDDTLSAAHTGRGDCMVEMGRASDAIPPYERARKNDPKNPVIILKLAYAKAVKGDKVAAKLLFDEAVEMDKDHLPSELLNKVKAELPSEEESVTSKPDA